MTRKAPRTEYRYEADLIANVYEQATADILRELERLDLSDFTRAKYTATLREVDGIIAGMNEYGAAWIGKNVPKAALNGIAQTLFALEVTKTLEEAHRIASFSRINKTLVDAIIADTQTDLLAVTNNISRRVRSTVRSVMSEVMRTNAAMGVLGQKTNRRDILANLYDRLGDSIDTGIIDAAGRRWRPESYVRVVSQTKLMDAHIEATTNEAVSRGALYAVISKHNAKDACSNWEGKIVKLVPQAPGPYPTIEEARASEQIWHPYCSHTISPLRDPALLNQ